MARKRPRLLVLGGPHVDAAAVGRSLGDQFEVVPSTPEAAMDLLGDMDCQAVLADAGDFLPLERDLIARQSSMLLNAIGEGVCLCSDAGRVLWSNQLFSGLDARVRRRVGAACRRAAEVFNAPGFEPARNGERRGRRFSLSFAPINKYYDVTVTAVDAAALGEAPRPALRQPITQLVAVVRDVTGRKLMQQQIDAIARAGGELVHIQPDAVAEMHVAERLQMLEKQVIRSAHDLLHFDHFAIRLVNAETNKLDLVMSHGLAPGAADIELSAEAAGNGISGFVAATGNSYICVDCQRDPLYVFGLEKAGSSLTVPLKLFDRVIGVFNIESDRTGAFTDTDRQFAEIFAQYIAMALHILNLLLVERYTTRETATGTVQGELSEPLNDLVVEAEYIKEQAGHDPALASHIDRILSDVDSIRKRIRDVGRGPRTLLGVDEALKRREIDPVLAGRRVLVADNESTMLETVRDILKSRGCRVVTCENGLAAIALLEQWAASHDAEEAFDLVVSDINLGDKTGYDVFRAAKLADQRIPIILMTGFGYDPHHSIVRASQEGLSCVLFKPFQAQKLIDEARLAVQSRQSGSR